VTGSAAEMGHALSGIKAVLRFDATAFRYFPGGLGPCLRSFQVGLWVLPLQALVVWLDLPEAVGQGDPTRYIGFQALAYLLSWLLYPLLLVPLSAHFHRHDRLTAYLSAFNWFQLVEFAVMTPIMVLGTLKLLPMEVDLVMWLTATAVLLAYEWFLLRRGLELEPLSASSMVLMNFLLNLLIYRAAEVLA